MLNKRITSLQELINEIIAIDGKTLCKGFDEAAGTKALHMVSAFADAIRAHGLIESVHWTLDVIFNEDKSRVRKENASENMALIRHSILNRLNHAKKQIKNIGIKAPQKKAGCGSRNI